MAAKKVIFHAAAREKILAGASQLADAVRITLGPRSKSVLIEKKWGAPIVCNDGVTIAKEDKLYALPANRPVRKHTPKPRHDVQEESRSFVRSHVRSIDQDQSI